MRKFVNDRVVAVIEAAVGGVVPGQDDRAAVPGFARKLLAHLVLDAVLVDEDLLALEARRVDDDRGPAVVTVDTELEDRQAGLQRDHEAHRARHLETPRALEGLAVQEQHAKLHQAQALVIAQPVEQRQGVKGLLPFGERDVVALERAAVRPLA